MSHMPFDRALKARSKERRLSFTLLCSPPHRHPTSSRFLLPILTLLEGPLQPRVNSNHPNSWQDGTPLSRSRSLCLIVQIDHQNSRSSRSSCLIVFVLPSSGNPTFKLTLWQDSVATPVTLPSRLIKHCSRFIQFLPDCALSWATKTSELSDKHMNHLNTIELNRKWEADF
jgi:hypothetical protein